MKRIFFIIAFVILFWGCASTPKNSWKCYIYESETGEIPIGSCEYAVKHCKEYGDRMIIIYSKEGILFYRLKGEAK